jgi:hypothetical protein
MILLPCPHCRYDHDISGRVAGDRLWCLGRAFCVQVRA